jgi:hypothetical protein
LFKVRNPAVELQLNIAQIAIGYLECQAVAFGLELGAQFYGLLGKAFSAKQAPQVSCILDIDLQIQFTASVVVRQVNRAIDISQVTSKVNADLAQLNLFILIAKAALNGEWCGRDHLQTRDGRQVTRVR